MAWTGPNELESVVLLPELASAVPPSDQGLVWRGSGFGLDAQQLVSCPPLMLLDLTHGLRIGRAGLQRGALPLQRVQLRLRTIQAGLIRAAPRARR